MSKLSACLCILSLFSASNAFSDSEWQIPEKAPNKIVNQPEIVDTEDAKAVSDKPIFDGKQRPQSTYRLLESAPFPNKSAAQETPIAEERLIGAGAPLTKPTDDPAAQMADFWPVPKSESQIYIRMYDYQGPSGEAPKHLLQKIIFERADKKATYFRVEDWIRDYSSPGLAFTWASTWHMKKDVTGEVTEYADSVVVFSSDYKQKLAYLHMNYKPGKEILWGKFFNSTNESALLKGSVLVDEQNSTATNYDLNGIGTTGPYPSGTAGYNWVSLLGNYKGYSVKGVSYDPSLFKLYQTFCTTSGCEHASSWEVYVNYYMVKNKGAVRMDYYKREVGESGFKDKGSHLMSAFCEADRDAIDCP